jgi:nucleoid-associated protein Lsr2
VGREWRADALAWRGRIGLHPSTTSPDLGVVALSGRREDILAAGEGGLEVAQKVSVTYACDYDQKEIPHGQHRVRRFSFDGRDYEIDLCVKHSDKFDDTISRYAQRARKSSARPVRVKRRTAAHRQHSASVRAWAKKMGIEVSDRGRIPADVVTRYEAAHN